LEGPTGDEALIQEVPPPEPQVLIVPSPEANQAQIMMGHQGVSATNPDRFRIALMNAILGGNAFSSRLFERVRVQEGLTYSISSSFEALRNSGLFLVRTFTRIEETPRMISLIKELVGRMQTDPPSDQELLDAKSSLVLGYPLKVETIGSVVDRFTDTLFYRLPISDILDYQERIHTVTKSEVVQAAQSYLYPERFLSVVVGPPEPLRQALEPLRPSLMPMGKVQP
jgi:zinc protease